MAIDMKFIARSTPAILVLGGLVTLWLCGNTNVDVFCKNWGKILWLGIILSILWFLHFTGILKKLIK